MGQITNRTTACRRRRRLGARRPPGRLRFLRRQGGDAAVGVDRDPELVEEVPTEETVQGSMLDVVRDDEKPADFRAANLEGVEHRRLYVRGPRRAANLAGLPLRQRHPGRRQRARVDDGPVGARVEHQPHQANHTVRRVGSGRAAARGYDAFFSSSFFAAAVESSFVASVTPFLNSLTLDPSDRASSGSRLAPKRINTITRMINSSW